MRKLLSIIAMLVLSLSMLMAQNRTVTGSVISAEDGEPVIGATVIVPGTNIGTVTGLDGKFSLNVPENAKQLTISYVGMASQTVNIRNNKVSVYLEADDKILDDVVVTALGLKKSEKSIGYAATNLKSEDLHVVPVSNVGDAIAGKVAGVSVSTTSTSPGAASSITIRSFSSLTGNNQPLWVIDGVPIVNNNISSNKGDNTMGGGASQLNQDDIEGITILKGAAATALYGSRAANGVILVTTKSGSSLKDKNFMVELNAGMQWSTVGILPQMQNVFGQGWDGSRTLDENGSWGPQMDGKERVYGAIYDNAQLLQKFQAVDDNVRGFFDTGVSYNTSISVAGKSDKTDYYLSYSRVGDDGIMPTDADSYGRNTISMNGSHRCTDWLKFSSNINFANSLTKTVLTDQGTTVIDGLYEMPRNISVADLADLSSPFNTPLAYYTEYGITNPYWALENNYSQLSQKKIYGKVQVDINPIKDLTLTYRFGFDYSDYDLKEGMAKISADNPSTSGDNKQDGSVYALYQRRYEINHDFLANYMHKWGDFDFSATAGVNLNERYATQMSTDASDLTIESGWWHLANAASLTPSESQSKRRLVGVLGDMTLGWKDQLFLDLTGRNDWSSTLPKDGNNFFYAGITGSWIFSEMLPDNMKDYISYGKVRAAYGKTGNDADPYLTLNTFVSGFANNVYTEATNFPMSNGTNAFKTSATLGSNTLTPEFTTEWELGADLYFLKNRIHVDFSYYDRKSDDQIMTLNADPASGYSFIVTNFGSIRNHGVELMVNFTPVRTKDWQWDVNFNWNKNYNNVEKLPEELGGEYVINSFSTSKNAVRMKAVVGQELGQFYTYEPQYVDANGNLKYIVIDDVLQSNPAYSGEGNIVVNESDGLPVLTTDVVASGKSTQNKWTGGFGTSLRYKGFSISANFDVRYGGYMFSRTKNLMRFTGNGIETIYNQRRAYIIPGSVNVTTDDNGKNIVSENYTAIDTYGDGIQALYDLGGIAGGEELLIDRTYLKLRTLAVSYTLPKAWSKKVFLDDVRVSFVANNLFTWTPASNCYIDPDVSSYGTDLSGSFGELYSNPSCRKYGFNIAVKF